MTNYEQYKKLKNNNISFFKSIFFVDRNKKRMNELYKKMVKEEDIYNDIFFEYDEIYVDKKTGIIPLPLHNVSYTPNTIVMTCKYMSDDTLFFLKCIKHLEDGEMDFSLLASDEPITIPVYSNMSEEEYFQYSLVCDTDLDLELLSRIQQYMINYKG